MCKALLLTTLVFVVALAAPSASATKFSALNSCPIASPTNIGCYCTHGCSIDGDTAFPWNAPVFPPALIPAATMGSDTICAKITIPTTTTATAKNLSAYLGVTGQISKTGSPFNGAADNSEVTIWTAFTTAECAKFVLRVKAAIQLEPSIGDLNTEMCSSESCNVVNLPAVPAKPVTLGATPAQLPGVCPAANMNKIGCFCTNKCSINGDVTSFVWAPNVWPPARETSEYVGSDTICAQIQIPLHPSAEGVALSAYLGVNGNINVQNTNYFGGALGTTVTVYTAFTTDECNRFVARASALTARFNINTSVTLCNTAHCNAPSSIVPSFAASPSILGLLISAIMAVVMAL